MASRTGQALHLRQSLLSASMPVNGQLATQGDERRNGAGALSRLIWSNRPACGSRCGWRQKGHSEHFDGSNVITEGFPCGHFLSITGHGPEQGRRQRWLSMLSPPALLPGIDPGGARQGFR